MSLDITITDMFCGAGGSTTGAVQAGATVHYAINHWDRAIETHNTNYPNVKHVLTDLHVASPQKFESTTILIAAPECTAHTIAKGKKRTGQEGLPPLWDAEPDVSALGEERSRCLMWTPLDWAEHHNYQAVILENVIDVHLWRPFEAWLQAWQSLGYDFELVPFNSMHAHPTPQSRDRIYFVAWKRGNRKPDLAMTPPAYCLRCEKEVCSLRAWKKPEAWTNPRLQCGRYKFQYVYVCPHCNKDVTPYYYAAINAIDWSLPASRIGEREKPLADKTMERIAYGLQKLGEKPFVLNTSHSQCQHASYIVDPKLSPLPTQTTRQEVALALPPGWDYWVMTYYRNGGFVPVEKALPTVVTVDHHALVTTPIQTARVEVEDCGFRMLEPSELRAAMAFPDGYVIKGTKKEQVKMLGNACTPPVIKLLMERVMVSLA